MTATAKFQPSGMNAAEWQASDDGLSHPNQKHLTRRNPDARVTCQSA